MNKALERAAKIVGTYAKLADILSLTDGALHNWHRRAVPPRYVIQIEKATNGAVKRWELRPDIYPPEDYI